MRFSGKVVIVTGAGSGMGRSTALLYGREEAHVLAADIDEGAAGKTAEEIRDAGGQATPHQVDLSGRDEAHAMIRAAVSAFGRLDILANVAGIYPTAPLERITEEQYDRVMAVDVKGPLFACQAAVEQMKAQGGGGAIVNVASGAAFVALKDQAMYSAAKGGLVSMSRVVALEAAPYGIRVNVVVPGNTATQGVEMKIGYMPDSSDALPLNERWLRPDEIGEVILWCTSEAASMVNGALFRVDGGRRML